MYVSIVVCPFILFILAIVFSALLRYTESDYPFGIFKLFLLYYNKNTILKLTLFGCYERSVFIISTMFVSSLPSVVCRGFMSYLRCLCLFAHSGDQHILFCVFIWFFVALCTLCCQFLCIVHFLLPLRYSLTFI